MYKRETPALRNKVKEEEHLRYTGGLREETGMRMYLHGPMYDAKRGNCDFGSGIWTYQKEERGIPIVGRRRKMHRCALVAK